MRPIVGAQVGEPGFVAFLGELVHLGVLTRLEKREWLVFHGTVMRATSASARRRQEEGEQAA